MMCGTYDTAFRKLEGNRELKQLQFLPFCKRGWRMAWRMKEEKGCVCAPHSLCSPSRRGREVQWPGSHRVTDPGSFRKALESFLISSILFTPPPATGKEKLKATRVSLLLSFQHPGLSGADPSVQPKWSQCQGSRKSPGPAQPVLQGTGKTQEHQNLRNYLAAGCTLQERTAMHKSKITQVYSLFTHRHSYLKLLAQGNSSRGWCLFNKLAMSLRKTGRPINTRKKDF